MREKWRFFWSRVKGQPIADPKEYHNNFAILEDISLKKRYDESLKLKRKYRGLSLI
jgi:hypothetical protein